MDKNIISATTTLRLSSSSSWYPWQPLTSLVGGDVYGDVLGRVRALVADTVDCLYLEAVEGVSPQVADQHPGLRQAQLARDEVHIVVAVGAGAPVGPALLAHYVVDDIVAAARLPGRVPLEDHGGFVHNGDHIPRAGWDTYGHAGKRCRPNGDLHPPARVFLYQRMFYFKGNCHDF